MILRTEAEDIGGGEPLMCFALEKYQGQASWPTKAARRLAARYCGRRAAAFLYLAFIISLFGFDAVFTPGNTFCLVHMLLPF